MTGFSRIQGATGVAGVDINGLQAGDLSGSYPNPYVVGLQDHPIDPRDPAAGDTLVFHAGSWVPTPSPTSITTFKGPWDANTNTPDIKNFPGLSDGFTWIVTVAGNYSGLDSITSWALGDYALYSNGAWYKLSSKDFGWSLTGNAGTVAGVDFVGTLDAQSLIFKTNGTEVLKLCVGGGSRLTGSSVVLGDLIISGGYALKITKSGNGHYTAFKVNNSQSSNIDYTLPREQGVSGSFFTLGLGGQITWNAPVSASAGAGLVGGGTTASNFTISMPNVGSAGTYGNGSTIPVFTTDDQGRVSNVTATSVQISESQVTNLLTDLTASANYVSNLSSSFASQKADKVTSITAGTGLVGGGDLSTNLVISLGNTGSAGTYGTSAVVPVFTTDAQGRVSNVSATSIQISESQVTNLLTDLTASVNYSTNLSSSLASQKADKVISVTTGVGLIGGGDLSTNRVISLGNTGSAGTYGSAAVVPVFVTDAQGRVTSVTNTSASIDASQVTSGILSISRGGTGLSSSGGSGNVLVSNGSAWASVVMTGSVTINSGGVTNVNSVQNMPFTASPTPSEGYSLIYTAGQWTPTSPTLAFANSYQVVRAQGAISAGDVCYIVNAGGSNPYPTVSKAQANSLSTVKGVLGLATENIANNATGSVQTYGQLVGPVDTNTFTQGSPLFVSTTVAGGVTDVKPSGPNYAFQVGFVTRQGQPNNITPGIVFVSPMMQTDTQNISDLIFSSKTEHDVVTYEAATSTWKNKQPLWVPNTQTAVSLSGGSIITAANFLNVVYLPIQTAGGASITLNLTTPIASLSKTSADYGRELWLHNLDNTRNVTIPAGGNVKLDGGVQLVMTPNTFVKFVWTGIGGNGAWVQTSKAIVVS